MHSPAQVFGSSLCHFPSAIFVRSVAKGRRISQEAFLLLGVAELYRLVECRGKMTLIACKDVEREEGAGRQLNNWEG